MKLPVRSAAGGDCRPVAGLEEIAGLYDGFIFDIWGVVHDGRRLFPEAADCFRQLHDMGKPYIFLSNMPRRAAEVARALTRMGLDEELSGMALTSGETVRLALTGGLNGVQVSGRRYVFQGPPRTRDIVAGLDLEEAEHTEEADFVLLTGIGDDETPADYEELLRGALARRLPMLCANPDLHVGHGKRLVACAGLLAQAYEERGGRVLWLGKPHRAPFDMARQMLGTERVLMVGDSLRTDIAGAAAAGLATLLITGGIHNEELHNGGGGLTELCRRHGCMPDMAMPLLRW